MVMESVNVATLKQKLSEYLRRVEEGDEIDVTSHRRHIARLIPAPGFGARVRGPIQPLTRLRAIRGVTARPGFSAVESLATDRRAR